MLAIDVATRLGSWSIEIRIDLPARGVVVLAGESGAGKSTLLRLLAGLLAAERGRIVLDDAVLFDSERNVDVPPEERPIAWVPQDYALFPHLSVFDNVAFGLRASRVPGAEVRRRVGAMLERLEIAELAGRQSMALSGGQQQRVALARALVLEPRLLLLDEPLASLDASTRQRVRGELARLLAALPCTTLLVTHAPAEALALGERIAVLEGGRLTQYGTREELLARPRSVYIAEFLGINLFRGRLSARDSQGLTRLIVGSGAIAVADSSAVGMTEAGEVAEVYALLDPREITLSLEVPSGSARNVIRGTIAEMIPEPPDGERLRVRLDSEPRLVAEITRSAAEAMALRSGDAVWASFKATGVKTFR